MRPKRLSDFFSVGSTTGVDILVRNIGPLEEFWLNLRLGEDLPLREPVPILLPLPLPLWRRSIKESVDSLSSAPQEGIETSTTGGGGA
eukprot:scaffold62208_cov58-Attheya_sp.AAC.2